MTSAQQAYVLVTKADEDIHVLEALCSDSETSEAVWGFHAQQAVEKLLKALLAYHGITFPFTHRLLELADLLADSNTAIDDRFEPLLDLTSFAVEFRYSLLPTGANEQKLERRMILQLTREFREYATKVINSPNDSSQSAQSS